MNDESISLVVNGHRRQLTVDARRTLCDVLRHDLGLTGTHVGCEQGVCGACTVIVDGLPVRSCLMLGVQADGSEVETVEGLATGQQLHPVQDAFSEAHGLQCGFCTPGFLMLAVSIQNTCPNVSHAELVEMLSSNLCRCTGYKGIVEAVSGLLGGDDIGERLETA